MNQRRLDLALLGGIGVLLLVILALALSSAPTLRAGDIGDPAARVAEPAAPAESRPAEVRAAPAEPDSEADERGGEAQSLAAPPAEEGASAPSASATEVGRVGFAYATGGEGACGVPLTAWAFVAVSRDLLETYPCGTAVTLTLNDEIAGRREVRAQVGDTMSASITSTVNVFVGEEEPALEYGVTQGSLSR